MKKVKVFVSLAVLIAFIFLDGCMKPSEKITNKITIAGNNSGEMNGEYIPFPALHQGW
jgi:hypothetical protein